MPQLRARRVVVVAVLLLLLLLPLAAPLLRLYLLAAPALARTVNDDAPPFIGL